MYSRHLYKRTRRHSIVKEAPAYARTLANIDARPVHKSEPVTRRKRVTKRHTHRQIIDRLHPSPQALSPPTGDGVSRGDVSNTSEAMSMKKKQNHVHCLPRPAPKAPKKQKKNNFGAAKSSPELTTSAFMKAHTVRNRNHRTAGKYLFAEWCKDPRKHLISRHKDGSLVDEAGAEKARVRNREPNNTTNHTRQNMQHKNRTNTIVYILKTQKRNILNRV